MNNFYSEEELEMHEIMDALGLSEPEAQLMRLVRKNTKADGTSPITLDEFLPLFGKHTLSELDALFEKLEVRELLTRYPGERLTRPRVEWMTERRSHKDWLKQWHYRCSIGGMTP